MTLLTAIMILTITGLTLWILRLHAELDGINRCFNVLSVDKLNADMEIIKLNELLIEEKSASIRCIDQYIHEQRLYVCNKDWFDNYLDWLRDKQIKCNEARQEYNECTRRNHAK